MTDRLDPGVISWAVHTCKETGEDITDIAGFRRMIRFLSDQLLVSVYTDLN
jgi:ppGpp synthetase/RelA/SpoT-type nucleotidyltranferase